MLKGTINHYHGGSFSIYLGGEVADIRYLLKQKHCRLPSMTDHPIIQVFSFEDNRRDQHQQAQAKLISIIRD
jgi:hypothetical protein